MNCINDSSVVNWLGRRTCDLMVVNFDPWPPQYRSVGTGMGDRFCAGYHPGM